MSRENANRIHDWFVFPRLMTGRPPQSGVRTNGAALDNSSVTLWLCGKNVFVTFVRSVAS